MLDDFGVLGDESDLVGGGRGHGGMEIVGRLVGPFLAELAIAIGVGGEAATVSADPEGAIGIQVETLNTSLAEFGRIGGIFDDEAGAIEPREAVVGADPEVAIRGLGHAGDGAAGQAGFGVPDVNEIIDGFAGGTEAE